VFLYIIICQTYILHPFYKYKILHINFKIKNVESHRTYHKGNFHKGKTFFADYKPRHRLLQFASYMSYYVSIYFIHEPQGGKSLVSDCIGFSYEY
jgi:hypothetical protein